MLGIEKEVETPNFNLFLNTKKSDVKNEGEPGYRLTPSHRVSS
jgi:hypothetical protein